MKGRENGRGGAVEHRDDGQSVKELIGSMTRDIRDLIAMEAELAVKELLEKSDQAKRGAFSLAAGGSVALSGFIIVLAAASIGLGFIFSTFLPVYIWGWLGPLVIGGIAWAVGVAMARQGSDILKPASFIPHQSARSLREDARWLERVLK